MTDQQERDTEREAFEAAIRAQYPTSAAQGARLTLRRDMPGSTRFGQYVAEHIEFAWRIWQAARSQQQQQGWQPISEAPEGSDDEILVFKPRVGILVVRWLTSDDPDYQGEFWHTSWDHSVIEDATHWMPLPTPPTLSELNGGSHE